MNISSKLPAEKIEEILKKAIDSEEPVMLKTYAFSHETEIFTEQVLALFFRQISQESIEDYIVYCVKELIGNAKKANTKRIYFKEKGLDITDENDYKTGMKTFKADTFKNIKHYLKLQKENGLYIKLILQIKENVMNIEVRNNAGMTPIESMRIKDKLVMAKRFNNLEEVMTQVLDDSEGSGLGLIILILMMKKMGLDRENFKINGTDGETVVKIILPMETKEAEELEELEEVE